MEAKESRGEVLLYKPADEDWEWDEDEETSSPASLVSGISGSPCYQSKPSKTLTLRRCGPGASTLGWIDWAEHGCLSLPAVVEKGGALAESLRTLRLSDQGLVDAALPPHLWDIASLQTLDLSRNELSTLPGQHVARLTALRVLDVSRNRLMVLPTEVGSLPKLERLYAQSNRLRKPARSLASPLVEGLASPASAFAVLDLRFNDKLRGAAVAAHLAECLPGVKAYPVRRCENKRVPIATDNNLSRNRTTLKGAAAIIK